MPSLGHVHAAGRLCAAPSFTTPSFTTPSFTTPHRASRRTWQQRGSRLLSWRHHRVEPIATDAKIAAPGQRRRVMQIVAPPLQES
jgi:hypothetical protein